MKIWTYAIEGRDGLDVLAFKNWDQLARQFIKDIIEDLENIEDISDDDQETLESLKGRDNPLKEKYRTAHDWYDNSDHDNGIYYHIESHILRP